MISKNEVQTKNFDGDSCFSDSNNFFHVATLYNIV